MTEKNHTPGPWAIGKHGAAGGIGIDAKDPADGENFEVCEVWGIDLNTKHDERSQANTKLIAAAPDLLADLVEAAATLRRYETLHRAKGTDDSTAKAEVNAALASRFEATIAKATE
jgi:hypothetical protein